MATSPFPSRRQVLAAAGAVAIGLTAAEDSSAAPAKDDAPRLPLNILLRVKLADDVLQQVRAISPQITIGPDVELVVAHAIFGGVSPEELSAAKNLKWVQCPSAGVEHYSLGQMIERDVILTNAKGCHGPQIAEHAFGLLFGLTRGIGQQVRQMSEQKWGSRSRPVELRGMTMGIIGLGGIGREVARRAKAMDMKVLAVDAEPMLTEQFAMVDEVTLVDRGLESMLQRSDVLVCCAPHTEKSRGMLGAEQFKAMKPGSYFINVSRGKIVKTDALLEALESSHLAGAGLDVTDPEPLPADHPLWQQSNVIVTSHIAGQSQFTSKRVDRVFSENAARFAGGLAMLNVVDKSKGY